MTDEEYIKLFKDVKNLITDYIDVTDDKERKKLEAEFEKEDPYPEE
jgi:hypothetical protein